MIIICHYVLASDCYTFMQNGTEFLKLRPGGRQYQRLYQLSTSLDMLVWRPSSKKPEKAVCEFFWKFPRDNKSMIHAYLKILKFNLLMYLLSVKIKNSFQDDDPCWTQFSLIFQLQSDLSALLKFNRILTNSSKYPSDMFFRRLNLLGPKAICFIQTWFNLPFCLLHSKLNKFKLVGIYMSA